ncbi:MAG: MFS transporter [Dehalococcoidia bacterium]|nr:MFS transporter [Dehalococcoidia bacterium]
MRALRNRVYYGWVIVGVVTLAGFTQVGTFNPILAVFVKPFHDVFGWSRAEVSMGITLGSIGGGLIGPFLGPLIDRRGARAVLLTLQAVYGTCLLSLTFVNGALIPFVAVFAVGRTAAQAGANLANQVAIANWFVRYRGRAMGVTNLGNRLGQAVLPGVAAFLIETVGWRFAWLFLGAQVWILAMVPCLLLMRRRPEDLGLLPDGAQPAAPNAGTMVQPAQRPQVAEAASWGARQAVRTRALWLMTVASCFSYFVGAGINLHLYPFLGDSGISVQDSVLVSGAFFTMAAVGSLAWGALMDRFAVRYCMAFGYAISAATNFLLLSSPGLGSAFLFAVIYGFAFGGVNTSISIVWASYFGRTNLGAITGLVLPIQLFANALGPLFGGMMYDRFGDYHLAFLLYGLFTIFAGLAAALAGPPRPAPQAGAVAA